MQSDWISYAIGGLGLVVGIVGIVLYVLGRRDKRPTFKVVQNNRIAVVKQAAKSDVEIIYKPTGEVIDNLFYADLLVWNDGREPIRDTDLVANSPLRIVLQREAARVLSATVVEHTRAENEFAVEKVVAKNSTTGEASIQFKFLDHKDGVRVAIAYMSDKTSPIQFTGTVVGAPQGFREGGQRLALLQFLIRLGAITYIGLIPIVQVWLLPTLQGGRRMVFLVFIAGLFMLPFFIMLGWLQKRAASQKEKMGLRYYFTNRAFM